MSSLEHELLEENAPLRPRGSDCPIPLANSQRRVWRSWQRSFGAVASATRISGPLNTSLLQGSVEMLVQRHESLRTRIVVTDDVPRQVVDAGIACRWERIDLSMASFAAADSEARRIVEEFIAADVDISAGPLFRTALIKLSASEHVMALALDHFVADAASIAVLNAELWTLYDQAFKGLPQSLPPLVVQFGDYAVWQQRTYQSWLRRHEGFWRERLVGAPYTRVPLDFDAAAPNGRTNAALHIPFGKKLSLALQEVAQREQIRLSIVVLAAYLCACCWWCRQRDLVVGFAYHGRHGHHELEEMVGYLVGLLHLRTEFANSDTFLDLVKRTQAELDLAFNHYHFDRVSDLIPDCGTELSFNWMSGRFTRATLQQPISCGIRLQSFPVRMSWSVGKWFFSCSDTAAGIVATVLYQPDLFERSRLEQFGQHLRLFAQHVVERPTACVASALDELMRS